MIKIWDDDWEDYVYCQTQERKKYSIESLNEKKGCCV